MRLTSRVTHNPPDTIWANWNVHGDAMASKQSGATERGRPIWGPIAILGQTANYHRQPPLRLAARMKTSQVLACAVRHLRPMAAYHPPPLKNQEVEAFGFAGFTVAADVASG